MCIYNLSGGRAQLCKTESRDVGAQKLKYHLLGDIVSFAILKPRSRQNSKLPRSHPTQICANLKGES
jgi:hypothetical protein